MPAQNQPQIPEKLPEFLHKYFWDTDATKLNPREAQKYVAERLMNWGDFDVFSWLVNTFPKDLLKDVALNCRDIAKRNRPFWLNYLHAVSIDELCSQKELIQQLNVAWPY